MPPDQDFAPERSVVAAVLRAHGLSGQAIAQVWDLSRDMRRRTRRRGLEYAATLNVETGTTIGAVVSGGEDSVDLRPHITSFVRGRRYVQFHTHPGSTSFSDADVAMLLSWTQVQAMVVLGVDGTWYALSRLGEAAAAARDAADLFLIEFDRLKADRPELPLPELTHQVWLTIAARLGLRYDRMRRREA